VNLPAPPAWVRRPLVLAALAALALLALAGGLVCARGGDGGPPDTAARLVPASALAYVHVSTDPAEKYVHTFDRPGRYDVSCDMHLGMSATIVATASPYFAVADANCDFTIRNVEPGSYKLTALVSGENLEQSVEVSGPRTECPAGTLGPREGYRLRVTGCRAPDDQVFGCRVTIRMCPSSSPITSASCGIVPSQRT